MACGCGAGSPENAPTGRGFYISMEVKINLVALVLVGLKRGEVAVLRSSSPEVSVVLAIVPVNRRRFSHPSFLRPAEY